MDLCIVGTLLITSRGINLVLFISPCFMVQQEHWQDHYSIKREPIYVDCVFSRVVSTM